MVLWVCNWAHFRLIYLEGVKCLLAMLIFVLGLMVGSFLNVVIYRLPRSQSVSYPPSNCPECNTRLKPLDLLPVVSWLYLKGRCRYCSEHISTVYPATEMFTALMFLFLSFYFNGWQLVSMMVLAGILTAAAVMDYQHCIIPNRLVISGFILGVPLFFMDTGLSWKLHLLGVLAGGGPLLFLAMLTRGGMGGGDIKLAGVVGLFQGPRLVLLTLFIGSLLAGSIGIGLIMLGKKGRKDTMVFGPFLAVGAFIAIIWGGRLLNWYFSRL